MADDNDEQISHFDTVAFDEEQRRKRLQEQLVALSEAENKEREKREIEARLERERRLTLSTSVTTRPTPIPKLKVPLSELDGEELWGRMFEENFLTLRAWLVWIPVILFFYYFIPKAYIDHHPWPLLIIVGAALINSPASRVIVGGLAVLGVVLYVLFKLFVHVY